MGTALRPSMDQRATIPMRPVHGFGTRHEEAVPPGTTFKPGRFGRMFPRLAGLQVTVEALTELAKTMIEADPADRGLNNEKVPAGFTYFGQFVDHDMSFDPTSIPEQTVDPQAIFNFRTPKLDLDSVYGLGPSAQPYLYDAANRAKLLIGNTVATPDQDQKQIPAMANDVPRNSQGFALIGDPRNDENIVVAQFHLAMLKFHNGVLDHMEPDPAKQEARFEEVRRCVTWHYQWIVLHDFIGRMTEPGLIDKILKEGRKHYNFEQYGTEPFIPVEFSVGAYRFGHTMVRNGYDHNRVFGPGPGRLGPGSLELLFFFTGPTRNHPTIPGLVSAPLPSNWVIDWRRFFELGNGGAPRNHSRRLDPLLAPELHDLLKSLRVAAAPANLAERNLVRGLRTQLPSGQAVAWSMGLEPLEANQIGDNTPDGKKAKQLNLHKSTPLWYYILKEAQVVGGGERLGPVGSRIVAEVFVGLLEGDARSFLSQSPCWTPTLPSKESGKFTMADLLTFADKSSAVINGTEDPRVINQ